MEFKMIVNTESQFKAILEYFSLLGYDCTFPCLHTSSNGFKRLYVLDNKVYITHSSFWFNSLGLPDRSIDDFIQQV